MPIWELPMIDRMKFKVGCAMQAVYKTGAEA